MSRKNYLAWCYNCSNVDDVPSTIRIWAADENKKRISEVSSVFLPETKKSISLSGTSDEQNVDIFNDVNDDAARFFNEN